VAVRSRIDKNARIKDLPRLPSSYLRRIHTDTVAPQAAGSIRTAMDFYGHDHVMYGTDHPCWSPHAAREVIGRLDLDEARAELLYSANARAVFGLT
jgi:aminocarboxymuconate-semialdehyde decarboxylase